MTVTLKTSQTPQNTETSVVPFTNDSFIRIDFVGELTVLNHLVKRFVHFTLQLSAAVNCCG